MTDRVMNPERVVVVTSGSAMLVGAATGLAGILLPSSTLKMVAKWSLAIGVGVSFLPLTLVLLHSLYLWLRGQDQDP